MKITKLFTQEVKIGIAGIVALCLLVYGINYLKGVHMFKPSSYFYVKYNNINGLSKSSPVFADGFKIGVVRDIYYDYTTPGNVTVEVELDKDMRIPKGSSAELVMEMLGTVRMNILLANNLRESYSIGDTIPGITNYGMMETVTSFVPKIENMLPKLDSILISLNAILSNENIPATLNSMKNITADLEVTSTYLARFMKKDVPELTSKLNIIGDNFIEVSNNLKEIDMKGLISKIDRTLANVKLVTDQLNSNDNTLGLLLNDPQLYHNLNSTAINASTLLEDLQSNPKRYVHFSLFGRKDKTK